MKIAGVRRAPDGIAGMFVPAATAMIFSTVAGFLASAIDGIITSKFLGRDAYSAVSLFSPMVNLILMFAYFIAIGGQVLSSKQIGAGEKEQASAVFSFSVAAGLVITGITMVLGFLAPGALFSICGISDSKPELYSAMEQYFRGYIWGIPSLILVQVISSFIVIDNGKRLISISAAVLCVSDIAGDLLNVWVFRGGVFGMGLATSISLLLQLAVLLTHFLRRRSYFTFSLKHFRAAFLGDIFKNGILTFMRSLATICRDLFTNHLNLAVAVGTVAVAAKGIQNDLNSLMFCLGIGIGKVLLTMSAMFYGADDRQDMKKLFACAMKTSALYAAGAGAVIFLLAPLISRIYTGDPEVISLAVFGIRCMAASLVMDTVLVAYQNYLQGIQNLKLVNLLCFTERFFIPVAVAFVMGRSFGSRGIIASIAVSKLILMLVTFVIIWIRCGRFPVHLEDYMLLPKDFGLEEGAELTARVRTMEDVVMLSREAEKYCAGQGTTPEKARLTALFTEEMAGNIVVHGKGGNRQGVCVDYRLYVKNERICISLRDYCEAFDPRKYYEIHKEEDPTKNIGIRMVMRLARDVRYTYTFHSNCTMILL